MTLAPGRHTRRVRVLILGDTHGVLDPRIAALAEGCAHVVHTGDVGAQAVLQTLGRSGAEVHAVRGNNDVPAKWPVGEQDALQSLPDRITLELPGGRLVVEHGHRANPAKARHARLRQRHPEARAVAYGHSHRLVIDDAESPWVLNPGAAGRARTYGGPSALVLEASAEWIVGPVRFGPMDASSSGL